MRMDRLIVSEPGAAKRMGLRPHVVLRDTLTGGNKNDRLYGMGGDDILYGNSVDNILEGRDGNDMLLGTGKVANDARYEIERSAA